VSPCILFKALSKTLRYSGFAEDVDGLVDSLNLLLDNLDIPLVLESPYDLTPSLLLAVLESTLKSRLPLSDKLRQAHSRQSFSNSLIW
jgi:hypothetical protein